MQERTSKMKYWGIITATLTSLLFGLFIYSRAIQTPQNNDSESFQTVQEAEAIVKGCHRYGLIEYSHHPIGRAYLLLPFIGKLDKLERIPLVIGIFAATLALFACLRISAPLLVKVPVLATFAALYWQGGFMSWLGNLHQHSYNFSIFLLLIAVGVTVRRPWALLTVLAFIAGWIGYDFLFIYAFTIVTIRFLYWTYRENNPWPRAAWASIGETSLFLAVFVFDMTLKFLQNTLYFSSAVMAQQDLFLNLLYRTSAESLDSMSISWRFQKAFKLSSVYVDRFISDRSLSNTESLLAVAGILLIVVGIHSYRTARAGQTGTTRRLALIITTLISSSMTILAWLLLAPNHAEPHVSIFARLLLVPCVLFPLCPLLGFARPRSEPALASLPKASGGIFLLILSAGLFALFPLLASQKIDQGFYSTAWDPRSAGIRADSGLGKLLSASPTASSTSPDSDLTGPLTPKGNMPLVYVTNFWGRNLDEGRSLRWMPDPKSPLPAWYQVTFTKPANVSHLALRFWDLPKNCGKNTPETFHLERIDQNGQVVERVPLSSNSGQPTHQGKYLNLLIPLSPSPAVSALRLVIEKTVGGDVPVLFDFHAFGTDSP